MQLDDNTLIGELDFSTRVAKALKNDGIETVGQLRALTDGELSRIPNLGRVSVQEIKLVLGGDITLCFRCKRGSSSTWNYCAWCGHKLGRLIRQSDENVA